MRALGLAFGLALLGCSADGEISNPLTPAPEHHRVWLDADPACWPTLSASDPDDCVAILLALAADVDVVGISTGAGNASAEVAWQTGNLIAGGRARVFKGAHDCTSNGIAAMAAAAEAGPLTILALGPLTNVARLISCRPDLAANGRVRHIVFVGGRRPGQRFVVNDHWPTANLFELADLNVETDFDGVRTVLGSPIPLILVPFEAGRAVTLNHADIASVQSTIPSFLDARLRSWSATSALFLGAEGAMQFDAVAVAYALWPGQFDCAAVLLELHGAHLIAVQAHGKGRSGLYCLPLNPKDMKRRILTAMARQPQPRRMAAGCLRVPRDNKITQC